jgi:homocitrate synthase NifV
MSKNWNNEDPTPFPWGRDGDGHMGPSGGIKIIDTTLRDGEQAPGVCFPPEIKVELLKMLFDAGIRDFEIGTPAIGPEERKGIRQMLALGLDANLSVWCRATIDDLTEAAKLGARQVNLSLPVSDIQLKAIEKDRNWMFKQLKTCLAFASRHFDFITIGAQDASRTSACQLRDYIGFSLNSPVVKRIRLADTVGIMNPFKVQDLVGKMVEEFPKTEIEFHAHNDMGMATANSLAAIVAGAQAVSVTVNGLGERCGNAPLEEVAMALEYTWSTATGIHLPKLQSVCSLVANFSGRRIHPSKPFSGEMCFSHESGIHTRSLLSDPLAYQPFNPEDIGREMQFVYGKHSGSASIKHLLQKRGLPAHEHIISTILDEVKTLSRYAHLGLSEDDVAAIYHQKFPDCHCSETLFTTENDWIALN